MNTFGLDINNRENIGQSEYYLNIKIDGDEFLKKIDEGFNVIYFKELKRSSERSGHFLIFTCFCGVADCGGWDYVKVTHEAEIIIWEFNYGQDYYFEFSIENYKEEIARIETEKEKRGLVLEPLNVVEPE